MKPSALLVTMSRYWGVARRLRDIAAGAPPGVKVHVETPRSFDEVPALLRSGADLVALDGHGWADQGTAYFGTRDDTQFCPGWLRGRHGEGIVAPVVVLGFCWGAIGPFRDAIEASMSRSHVAFLGSNRKVTHDDAARIYPPLLDWLAGLGSNPEPAAAYASLQLIAPVIGQAWRPELLHRPTTTVLSTIR